MSLEIRRMMMRPRFGCTLRRVPTAALVACLVCLRGAAAVAAAPVSATIDEALLRPLVETRDWQRIRALGPRTLPPLARLYERSPEAERATIAWIFYELGWKSADAKRVLMKDVHTANPDLRLQVQWALGRVSDDPDVVDVLLDNMRHDASALFRDKAACALAYDQIHLAPAQKARLFTGLIAALEDDNPQVRQIALQALQILTGQTKGYNPGAAPEARRKAVEEWRRWLAELVANL